MSAGEFDRAKYELSSDNGGGIASVRVQPETIAATIAGVANDEPAGDVNLPVTAKVSKGKREFGIGCRTVTLEFTGTPPDGYSGDPVTIPGLTPAFFAAAVKGATGTYLSQDVEVVGRSPESVV